MKNLIRLFVSRWIINNFYHLPKAILANIFYTFPTKGLKVIGVTGTDGKTTAVNMIYQILKAEGKKVSMVSTLNATIGGKVYETGSHVTSPDPFILQKFARKSLNNGDQYLVLEVTSHALHQYRFWGIKFDIGIITNITHEHLDYHKSYETYENAKISLLKNVKFAIVNQSLREKIKNRIKGKILTFGLNDGDFNQREIRLKLKIPGDYNIENALAALACGFALDINRNLAQGVLERFTGVLGRMEEIPNKMGIKIIVDFAHTPNGLEQALKTLKKQTKGRLISIIGAEGLRDTQKRAMMGEIAQRLSNIVIVTSLDPRGDLETINRQISLGAQKSEAKTGVNFFVINDRDEAISFGIKKLAKKGDTIGIFGKGHEKSINLDGKKEIPWSDFEAVSRALNG